MRHPLLTGRWYWFWLMATGTTVGINTGVNTTPLQKTGSQAAANPESRERRFPWARCLLWSLDPCANISWSESHPYTCSSITTFPVILPDDKSLFRAGSRLRDWHSEVVLSPANTVTAALGQAGEGRSPGPAPGPLPRRRCCV